MKRFLGILIASFFLASGAVYAATSEKMEDTKEKKADTKSKDGKAKDGKSKDGKSKDDKGMKEDKPK